MIPRLLGRASVYARQPRTLAVVGGGSLALAVGVAFLPWLFPAAVFQAPAAILASPASILVAAGGAGLLGVQALRANATAPNGDERADRPDSWVPERAPERAYFDEHRTVGDWMDAAFDADLDARERGERRRAARNRIRETAVAVIADAERTDQQRAAERVRSGSWTDDPRAAAFLGGRHLAPLRTRIRDWASGERFERWATHAVAEIEGLDRGEVVGTADRAATDGFDGNSSEDDGDPTEFVRETEHEREVAR